MVTLSGGLPPLKVKSMPGDGWEPSCCNTGTNDGWIECLISYWNNLQRGFQYPTQHLSNGVPLRNKLCYLLEFICSLALSSVSFLDQNLGSIAATFQGFNIEGF